MTRLFNLESYSEFCHYARLFEKSEFCHYARLFEKSPEQLINNHQGDLARAYKALVDKYSNHPYLRKEINPNHLPQHLEIKAINSDHLNYIYMGQELAKAERERLLIVSDTIDLMTLSMSNLLDERDGYLYRSAYHYWNHYSELAGLTKPLVIIDLDSCNCSHLIPLELKEDEPYKFPILNTQEKIGFNLKDNLLEIYPKICQSIAEQILKENFPPILDRQKTVPHLANYLQKTFFFRHIKQEVNLDYLIEILHDNQIFYKQISLSIDRIKKIVNSSINLDNIKQLAKDNPKYQFVIASQYPSLCLLEHLPPNLIFINPNNHEFSRIWEEKIKLGFPLFGIYLDKIEFAVLMKDDNDTESQQWIELIEEENAISYEGEPKNFQARIPERNQEKFSINSSPPATLPIRVNGEDYCKNGVPQDFKIQITNPEAGIEKVEIKIQFHLQPGSLPKLQVTDVEGKYNITAKLSDRPKVFYSYLPIHKINSHRQEQSLKQIERVTNNFNLNKYLAVLTRISILLDNNYNNYENLLDHLKDAVSLITKDKNNFDFLLYVDVNHSNNSIQKIKGNLDRINKIFTIVIDILTESRSINVNNLNKLLNQIFIFIGKNYKLTQNLPVKTIFELSLINEAQGKMSRTEYFYCLARIAINKELQEIYFSWFKDYYTDHAYLWGYGRILLWYYNFEETSNLLDIGSCYQTNFILILDYLLEQKIKELNSNYKQNAFLTLLYSLTFRAKYPTFCQDDSLERIKANNVLKRFTNEQIRLNQVSKEKSLNQLFKEMLEGKATAYDMRNLVKAG